MAVEPEAEEEKGGKKPPSGKTVRKCDTQEQRAAEGEDGEGHKRYESQCHKAERLGSNHHKVQFADSCSSSSSGDSGDEGDAPVDAGEGSGRRFERQASRDSSASLGQKWSAGGGSSASSSANFGGGGGKPTDRKSVV